MEITERRKRRRMAVLVLLALLLAAAVWSITMGPAELTPPAVLRALLARAPLLGERLGPEPVSRNHQIIIFQVRLPRILLGALIGGALAGAGVTFQAIFKNPMAEPYVLGVSSGAALGATLAIVLGSAVGFLGMRAIPVFAFAGGFLTLILVYSLARHGGRVPVATLLLAGIAASSFLSALMSFIMVLSARDLHQIVFWVMGGISTGRWSEVWMIAPYIIVGLGALSLFTRELNILLLGDESAQHLGIDVERIKILLLVIASVVTAGAVAGGGVIGFVGLIIPHTMRLIVGPDHRVLLPGSILAGGIFLVLADILARTLIAPMEIPLGIITALFGAPFFIYLLRRRKRGLSL